MCDDEQNRSEAQHGNKDQLINFVSYISYDIVKNICSPSINPSFLPKHVETNVYEIKPYLLTNETSSSSHSRNSSNGSLTRLQCYY
jgi:hypothetical protein